MNPTEAEMAFEAMLLGINLAEEVHGIEHGSSLYGSLPDRLLEVANGDLIFTASGAEIRKVIPTATEESRARSQNAMRNAAKVIVEFIRSQHS